MRVFLTICRTKATRLFLTGYLFVEFRKQLSVFHRCIKAGAFIMLSEKLNIVAHLRIWDGRGKLFRRLRLLFTHTAPGHHLEHALVPKAGRGARSLLRMPESTRPLDGAPRHGGKWQGQKKSDHNTTECHLPWGKLFQSPLPTAKEFHKVDILVLRPGPETGLGIAGSCAQV